MTAARGRRPLHLQPDGSRPALVDIDRRRAPLPPLCFTGTPTVRAATDIVCNTVIHCTSTDYSLYSRIHRVQKGAEATMLLYEYTNLSAIKEK